MRATIYYGCIIIGLFLCPFTGGAGMIAMCFFAYVLGKMMGGSVPSGTSLFGTIGAMGKSLSELDNRNR